MSSALQVMNMDQTAAEWAARITACRNSGITVKQWCSEHQISPQTYYRWQRRIFPEPENNLVPVDIQIPDANDLPGIMFVFLHIHIPIPFYGLAVDTQSLCNGTLGKACLPHLMNLAVHVIPLHFVTAFPLEYSHCTREMT